MNQTIENIKAIRNKLKISQARIADGFGIDRATYSKLEKNKTNLRLEADLLIYCASIFKMSIDEVVNYHKNEYQPINNSLVVSEETEPYLIMNERNNFLKSQNEELKEHLKSYQFMITNSSEYNKRLMAENDALKLKLNQVEAKLAATKIKG